jgi:hypothetical protein
MGNLTRGGIDNYGWLDNGDGTFSAINIWRFEGYVTYTIGAFTSLQRDRLFDELVRVFAFSKESAEIYQFRSYIEGNPYPNIAMNMNFDDVTMRGVAESPGPWENPEMVYEVTVAMEVIGEFQSDRLPDPAYPIEEVIVTSTDPEGGHLTTEVSATEG